MRTGQTDAWAEELDRLLVEEFADSRAIERQFCDREVAASARDRTLVQTPSQEGRFYCSIQAASAAADFMSSSIAACPCSLGANAVPSLVLGGALHRRQCWNRSMRYR